MSKGAIIRDNEKGSPPAGALGVLEGLEMFQNEDATENTRRTQLCASTRRIVDEARRAAPDEVKALAGNDGDPSRPGQATRRQDVLEYATKLAAQSALAVDEVEEPRSPCVRARLRARGLMKLATSAQTLLSDMSLAIASFPSTNDKGVSGERKRLIERADAWEDLLLDLLEG